MCLGDLGGVTDLLVAGIRLAVRNVVPDRAVKEEDILADYEDLTREDILAALAFAARMAQTKRIEPLAA